MSDFGDFDPDDAVDKEPPDAFQLAKRVHKYRRESGESLAEWDDLPESEQERFVDIFVRVIAWLRRQGAIN